MIKKIEENADNLTLKKKVNEIIKIINKIDKYNSKK